MDDGIWKSPRMKKFLKRKKKLVLLSVKERIGGENVKQELFSEILTPT